MRSLARTTTKALEILALCMCAAIGCGVVHDQLTGLTTRVSVDSAGAEGNDQSFSPSISATGRFVAFESLASNLVAGDANGTSDVFVHDLQTGLTTRVSVDSSGAEANNGSDLPSISGNGRFVAFASLASNLATGDVNVIPVMIRGNLVESVIGEWDVPDPPFSGSGVALIRPDAFTIATPGEESDLIFGVEEASFRGGAWHTRGVLSGGVMLRVTFPRTIDLHKGKLLPLRYDPRAFRLIRKDVPQPGGIPTDVVPPLSESR